MTARLLLLTTLALLGNGVAEDRAPVEPKSLPAPDQKVAPVKPSVEKLEDGRFRIGKITFDQAKREIRIPSQINMTEGLLEFLVVHINGKVHESLFVTEASPTDLNLALALLRYKPSRELYPLPNGTGGISDRFPEVPEEIKSAARISIHVEWQDNGETKRTPVNEWIQHAVKLTAMPSGPWVYGGSEFHQGRFAPESTGDIVAVFITLSALINYPGEDNRDDTAWLVYPKRVPAQGTNVTLVIAPYKNAVQPSKP
jgi:hypothetical protein